MQLIPEPEPRKRTIYTSDGDAIFQSTSATNYVCGSCDTVLLRGTYPGQVRDLVIRCPTCQAFNEAPA